MTETSINYWIILLPILVAGLAIITLVVALFRKSSIIRNSILDHESKKVCISKLILLITSTLLILITLLLFSAILYSFSIDKADVWYHLLPVIKLIYIVLLFGYLPYIVTQLKQIRL